MPSDSSTLKNPDDIDLGWEDEPASPARSKTSLAIEARPLRTQKPAPSNTRRLSPPPKPVAKLPIEPIRPRPVLTIGPPSSPMSAAAPQSPGPRYSIRPVSVPPRPTSSSPRAERPRHLAASSTLEIDEASTLEIDEASTVAEPAILPLPPSRQEFRGAPLAAALAAHDVALAAGAPARPASEDALALSGPPPAPSEWPDAGADSLGPSHLDAEPELSSTAFRDPGPRRALMAIGGIVACAAAIALVARSSAFAPDTSAELSSPRPVAAAPPAAAARTPAPLTPPPTAEGATPAAVDGTPSGAAASSEEVASDAPLSIPVALHLWPPDASLFEAGRRLGTGDVTVAVAPGTKITLVARRGGYKPRTVVLDGSNVNVHIALSRAPGRRLERSSAKQEADSLAPSEEPSAGAASELTPPSDSPSASSNSPGSDSNGSPASAGTVEAAPLDGSAPP